jgi:hypothetical protein
LLFPLFSRKPLANYRKKIIKIYFSIFLTGLWSIFNRVTWNKNRKYYTKEKKRDLHVHFDKQLQR